MPTTNLENTENAPRTSAELQRIYDAIDESTTDDSPVWDRMREILIAEIANADTNGVMFRFEDLIRGRKRRERFERQDANAAKKRARDANPL